MKHGLLLLAALSVAILSAGSAAAANVAHTVCAKGYCGMVYDCPEGWTESNIEGTYLTNSYKYECSETLSNETEVPSGVAPTLPNTPQVQSASGGYSLSYTLSYLVSEKLKCPQMVANFTRGSQTPSALATPVMTAPAVRSGKADSYDIVFSCSYQ